MSRYGSASFVFILGGGYDLRATGRPKNISFKISALMELVNGLGDSSEANLPTGLSKTMLSQAGAFFDDTTNGIHDQFKASTGVSRVFAAAVGGNTLGQPFMGAEGIYGSDYEVLGQLRQLTKANVTYTVSGAGDWGKILQPYAAKTAAFNTAATSLDNGASSAFGGVGYLQVNALNLDTYTGLTAKIRHSTDNVTYADLLTFTTITTGSSGTPSFTGERKTVAGTVNRYLDVEVSFAGAGTAAFNIFVGFRRYAS
jgi:hypothetical protein